MKWTLFALCLFLTIGALHAQDDPRSRLKESIHDRYPGYSLDDTEKETLCTGETLWEVEIEMGEGKAEMEKTLLAGMDGQLRYEEAGISPERLPASVMGAFRQACPACGPVREVDRLTALDGSEDLYELEGRKGLRNWTLLISEGGKLICRK